MKKKFLCLLLALTLCLPFSSATVKAYEQISQENQERENLQKLELYQMMDDELREIGLSFEMLAKTQIDFSKTSEPPQARQENNRARMSEDPINFKDTDRYLSINQYAQKRYGSNPTEEEKMKMYLLYYFDVNDSDKTAGNVGPRLWMDYYCPEYMGENDESVYDAFIKTTYGAKLLNSTKRTAELVKSGSGLEKVSFSKLIKNWKSFKTWMATAKGLLKAGRFTKASFDYMNDGVLRKVKTVDDFMDYWDEALKSTPGEKVEENTREAIKTVVEGAVFSLCLGGPIGIVPTLANYTVTNLALTYLSLYDRAAINALAYTRSTRITLRQFDSWW